MEATSCQVERFCCFSGTNTVINWTSSFFALRCGNNWQSPSYTRGDDFQEQDDNNQSNFFSFLKKTKQ